MGRYLLIATSVRHEYSAGRKSRFSLRGGRFVRPHDNYLNIILVLRNGKSEFGRTEGRLARSGSYASLIHNVLSKAAAVVRTADGTRTWIVGVRGRGCRGGRGGGEEESRIRLCPRLP